MTRPTLFFLPSVPPRLVTYACEVCGKEFDDHPLAFGPHLCASCEADETCARAERSARERGAGHGARRHDPGAAGENARGSRSPRAHARACSAGGNA